MALFGAHMSAAGGCHNAVREAQTRSCQTVQLFTKNASQWSARDFTEDEVRLFRDTLRDSGLRFATAHDSYLINLASPDPALNRRSLEAFTVELRRAEQLGLSYLVMHPGALVGAAEEDGIARVVRALDDVHARCAGYAVQVLVETTAGQGTTLGWRFEQLAAILSRVAAPERLGVCFDTCHVFAAGYALAPHTDYLATMAEFDRTIGLDKIKVFHINDSLKPLGSRVDRHAHIGRGRLGLEPFRSLVNDPRFEDRPMILETPKEDDDHDDMDAVNLEVLRGLIASRRAARKR